MKHLLLFSVVCLSPFIGISSGQFPRPRPHDNALNNNGPYSDAGSHGRHNDDSPNRNSVDSVGHPSSDASRQSPHSPNSAGPSGRHDYVGDASRSQPQPPNSAGPPGRNDYVGDSSGSLRDPFQRPPPNSAGPSGRNDYNGDASRSHPHPSNSVGPSGRNDHGDFRGGMSNSNGDGEGRNGVLESEPRMKLFLENDPESAGGHANGNNHKKLKLVMDGSSGGGSRDIQEVVLKWSGDDLGRRGGQGNGGGGGRWIAESCKSSDPSRVPGNWYVVGGIGVGASWKAEYGSEGKWLMGGGGQSGSQEKSDNSLAFGGGGNNHGEEIRRKTWPLCGKNTLKRNVTLPEIEFRLRKYQIYGGDGDGWTEEDRSEHTVEEVKLEKISGRWVMVVITGSERKQADEGGKEPVEPWVDDGPKITTTPIIPDVPRREPAGRGIPNKGQMEPLTDDGGRGGRPPNAGPGPGGPGGRPGQGRWEEVGRPMEDRHQNAPTTTEAPKTKWVFVKPQNQDGGSGSTENQGNP